MADIKAFYDQPTGTVSYIVSDPATLEAAFIDPLLDFEGSSASLTTTSADAMLTWARDQGLKVVWSLDTHVHADHLSASDYVRGKTGAKIGIGEKVIEIQKVFRTFYNLEEEDLVQARFDVLFGDGDIFRIGSLEVKVMHTPGHTPACVTYVIGDAAFVGDTLFMPDFGTARTDFPGGDASDLYQSIRRILRLPEETQIFVGHDYLSEDRPEPAWVTSVAEQAETNVHANVSVDEASFVDVREARDATLKAPALILPSLQVNIRAGKLPVLEEDGHSYLKIPINKMAS
jgi:glyoxylase-like metal-dependent hydrolase (beta-lactamase superfamily II)